MKIKLSILALIAVTISTAFAATDDGKNTEYQLPDGRILKNPLVLERLPDGLEIGHDRGVTFVKFANLPEDIQKQYNYDPVKAKQYEKSRKDAQQAKTTLLLAAKNNAASKTPSIQDEKKSLDAKIARLELRVKFLDEEIPKLEAEGDKYLDKITDLESRPGDNNNTSNNFYWRGGGYMSNVGNAAAKRDAKTRAKTIEELAYRADEAKVLLEKYKKERQENMIQLNELRKRNLELSSK